MASTESTPCKETPMEEDVEEIEDEEDEEEELEDEDEEIEEEMDDEEGDIEVTVGRRSGRGLTLKTLLKERILEPGDGNMTINYLGNKFKGDLLSDGRIRSQETGKIFGTPSAWAIYCKKIVNPDKKSGCGWASVRYRGKKLDTYKNNWFRQKRLEYEKEEEMEEELTSESENGPIEQEILEFDLLGNRNPNHEPSTMIELTTFQSLGRIQPFNITMSSSAMAVIDVHAHLTTSEIVGYLAGQWDVNNHNLIVSHALPVRCRLGDTKNGPVIEQELCGEMNRLKLSLVGWYHSHPFTPPLPTLRDIDSQLDYEMKMKGYNDASYTPVLGIIVSPYQKCPTHRGIPHPNGNATGYWVMPPPENKPLEYGKPMSMQFTVVQDAFIPKEALLHMSEVVKYYHEAPDAITFTDFFEEKVTYWHKLKNSLQGRVPKDHFAPLIDFLRKIIEAKLPEEDPVLPPPVVTSSSTSVPPPSTVASSITTTSPSPSITTTSVNTTPTSTPSTTPSLMNPPASPQISHPVVPSADSRPSSQVSADTPTNYSKDKEASGSLKTDYSPTVFPSSESQVRERDNFAHPLFSHSPSPSPSVAFSTPDKYSTDEERSLSSTPKVRDEKTPPPKSFSPLFQHPPPPLFPIDSKGKEPQLPLPPHPFIPIDERRPFDLIQKSLASLREVKQLSSSSPEVEPLSMESAIRMANKSSTPTTKSNLLQPSTSYSSAREEGGFLDLSIGATKISEGSSKDHSKQEDSAKEVDERPSGLAAWFAQQKYAQDLFTLPPHERDNPFLRDPQLLHRELASLVSSASSSFGLEGSHWNSGLNFGKDLASLSQRASTSGSTSSAGESALDSIASSYSKKVPSASPTPFSFSLESHQNYHQESSSRETSRRNSISLLGREKAYQQESSSTLPPYMMDEASDPQVRDFRGSPHPFLPHRSRPDQSSSGDY